MSEEEEEEKVEIFDENVKFFNFDTLKMILKLNTQVVK